MPKLTPQTVDLIRPVLATASVLLIVAVTGAEYLAAADPRR